MLARSLTSRAAVASRRSASNGDEAKVKANGAFWLASAFYGVGFGVLAVAFGTFGTLNAAFGQRSTFAPEVAVRAAADERSETRRFDPLRRDALGVQTRYPAVAKIVGRDAPQTREDGSQTIPLYYGTGTLVAEVGEWGIVVSNWHVVSESRDSIVAKFPTFSSPARVVLRDETWDLAALVVRKPPRVAPIPISQEVPGVGDALWVAGYGESAGLTEFQIQGGRVQNYALLVSDDEEGDVNVENGKEEKESASNGKLMSGAASATVAKSAELTSESALLYETLAVDKGVRKGDSGGPIFNRYGELAGVLWGSNGESTMGTYCIRVQYFLTQAIKRLAVLEAERRLDASAGDFWTWRPEIGVADAEGTELWARTALEASGVHPISPRPAYVAADGRETPENLRRVGVEVALKRVRTALTVAENATATALPPSPPVFSPTFVSQQGLLDRVRPEVAEADFWANLVDSEYRELVARRTSEAAKVRETSVVDNEEDAPANVALAFAAENANNADFADEPSTRAASGKTKELDVALETERPSASTRKGDSESSGKTSVALWKPVGLDGGETRTSENDASLRESADWESDKETNGAERTEKRENGEEASDSTGTVDEEKSNDSTDGKNLKVSEADVEQENKGKRVEFNGVYLNDIQVYLIICAIFCLFYNAARLMTDAELKKEGAKREWTRPVEGRDD